MYFLTITRFVEKLGRNKNFANCWKIFQKNKNEFELFVRNEEKYFDVIFLLNAIFLF